MKKRRMGPRQGSAIRYHTLKRGLDAVFSCLLLFLLALPMALIGLCVGISSRGGVLFRQMRIGRGGVPFVCYKFRTMRADAPPDRPSADFPDAEKYITPVGRFLRRTSLDELPQLFNVLRGEMSLVGPRPLIGREGQIHRVRAEHGVYEVRPGMTGLAQVCGRTRLDDAQKVALDIRYVQNMSFFNDLRILGRTLFSMGTSE